MALDKLGATRCGKIWSQVSEALLVAEKRSFSHAALTRHHCRPVI
ncbi:hypothetical protein HMPREF9069_01499 [Atopobium sp. oral taxon 810 str. F0209]|nr:hypothetical protein HMPREF9069_01499 [Atopobium sp. oral taxon 810 str. F0209]